MDKTVSTKRPPPTSVRFSVSQKIALKSRAEKYGLSISGYIKFTALDQPPRKFRGPTIDRVVLAQLLAQLGKVGSNINQIAKMGHVQGEFSIPELTIALNELIDMREAIMKALGYQNPSGNDQGGRSS